MPGSRGMTADATAVQFVKIGGLPKGEMRRRDGEENVKGFKRERKQRFGGADTKAMETKKAQQGGAVNPRRI